MQSKGIFDCIIVGQGIAGSVLAYQLIKQGKRILVIDEPSLSNCSRIAAGIVNPVVFKRLTKSWKADEGLPVAKAFYVEVEQFFKTKIYFEKLIRRIFSGQDEKKLWLKKTGADVGKYLAKEVAEDGAEVNGGGYLDVVLFLKLVNEFLKKEKLFLADKFDFKRLSVSPSGIEYKEHKARKIVFCEGYRAAGNPYFKWLPFKLSKGELLTIKTGEHFEKIINKEIFVLPIGNGLYKVGATYEWSNLNEEPSEKGREELVDKLNNLLKIPYEIVAHEAGIRPTVSDRRPLIGFHPEYSSIGVFNGMGTKGVMLAPYFSKQFIDHMGNKMALDKEVDIVRFWK